MALALGCGVEVGPAPADDVGAAAEVVLPGQTAAVARILAAYGAPGTTIPPGVAWRPGEAECNRVAWRWGPDRRCIKGLFDTAHPDRIELATWEEAFLYQTSLAHELRHWWLFTTTGDGHPDHDGDFLDRVRAVNWALYLESVAGQ